MNYFSIPAHELGENAKIKIVKLGETGEVFYEMALEMIRQIEKNNAIGKPTVLICPVGPKGQYPIFVRLVNEKNLSLKNTWFINMDEYLDDSKQWIDINHKLSFRGFMEETVYSKIKSELVMSEDQRVFPDPNNPCYIGDIMEKLGGADIAFGGIGINGHIAFNEPEDISTDVFSQLKTRVIKISRETISINSVGDLNGAIGAMPRWCVTIGMNEILSAKKIRLYCFRDWHRAVVRQAAYDKVSSQFPVTIVQNHPDATITVTANVAQPAF